MILTSMPDLPPRPLTAANAAFRNMFYERWGHENTIVCGRSDDAMYDKHTQTLSIKTAWGGSERYFLNEREVAVDDDHWLVLNEGRRYGSVMKAARPLNSFTVFFRPGLQQEVASARQQSLAQLLDSPQQAQRDVQFSEHLRSHGGAVSTQLRAMRDAVLGGERSQDWLDQQQFLLLSALLAAEGQAEPQTGRRSGRTELERRLRLAADFIDTCHAQPLRLDDMAGVACLSRYHFVRHFRALLGLTPYAYLLRKRTRVARRLLALGQGDLEWVAQHCGFGSRFALARGLARYPDAD